MQLGMIDYILYFYAATISYPCTIIASDLHNFCFQKAWSQYRIGWCWWCNYDSFVVWDYIYMANLWNIVNVYTIILIGTILKEIAYTKPYCVFILLYLFIYLKKQSKWK